MNWNFSVSCEGGVAETSSNLGSVEERHLHWYWFYLIQDCTHHVVPLQDPK